MMEAASSQPAWKSPGDACARRNRGTVHGAATVKERVHFSNSTATCFLTAAALKIPASIPEWKDKARSLRGSEIVDGMLQERMLGVPQLQQFPKIVLADGCPGPGSDASCGTEQRDVLRHNAGVDRTPLIFQFWRACAKPGSVRYQHQVNRNRRALSSKTP